jgi:ATP-binding cassette, subfamily C, bacterial CydC
MRPFGRLVGLMAGQRRWLAIGALLAFLAVSANIALMALSAYLISRAALVSSVAEIALAITGVRVLAIGRAAFRYLERYVTHRATFAILTELRVWFYASIEPLAPARLADRRSGDLLARIVDDIGTLEDVYVRVLLPPVVAIAVAIFGAMLLGAFDPTLGLILVAFLLISGLVLPWLIRRSSLAAARDEVAARGELDAMVVDQVQGLADLVVLDRAAEHRSDLLARGAVVDRAIDRQAALATVGEALSAVAAGLAGVAVLAVGIDLVDVGRVDAVYLALLPLAAVACFEVIGPLSQAFAIQERTAAAASRLFEITDVPPPVVETEDGRTPVDARRARGVAAEQAGASDDHGIEFHGLRFRYGPDEPYVIDGLDLVVPSGSSLAILGPSGSGKSTLVNLLLRFWEVPAGRIIVGGRDLHDYTASEVRSLLGVVPQDVHLFNGTIRDNLAVADRDVTDDRIEAACLTAQVHSFIAGLPDGYQTMVGEHGALLSGGERQRLAIARAIIKAAPILILDEATANLDVTTEHQLLASLETFMAGRTTIAISHRPSVASSVDRVITMVDGRIEGDR